jgi:hypothetical protein
MKLNFIIAGAQKAGTSFLSQTLRQSNEVCIPEREVRHFRDPFYPHREKLDSIFVDCKDILLGIKHPSYLGREEVPERIYRHNPYIKLIFILRNPVHRAISSYLHYVRHGQIPLVHPNIGLKEIFSRRKEIPKYNDILEFGLYFKYLSLYRQYFLAESMLILEFEELFSSNAWLTKVSSFLGITLSTSAALTPVNQGIYDWSECVLQFTRAVIVNEYDELMNITGQRKYSYFDSCKAELSKLKSYIPKTTLAIDQEVTKLLADFYKEDIRKLKASGIFTPEYLKFTG